MKMLRTSRINVLSQQYKSNRKVSISGWNGHTVDMVNAKLIRVKDVLWRTIFFLCARACGGGRNRAR